MTVAERLEYLRQEIQAERISMNELIELQGLAEHIEPGDVELLEWAGVPEFPEEAKPMTINIGPARVEGTFLDVKVLHGDKILLKCGDRRRAETFAQGYNRGFHAGREWGRKEAKP